MHGEIEVMKELERLMIESKPTCCSYCGERVFFVGGGKYNCKICGNLNFDIYGKVKDFVEKNGVTSKLYMSQTIGVDTDVIEMILEQGTVKIPEESQYYLECINCGCSIREGKYCSFCKRDIAGSIRGLMYEDIQRNKRFLNPDMSGAMHYRRK